MGLNISVLYYPFAVCMLQLTLMLLLCGTTVLSAFWYWSLEVGPALYFAWIVAITFHLAGPFILFPLAALRTFGQTHYASNYGLISTVQVGWLVGC